MAEGNAIRTLKGLKALWEKLKIGASGSGATYYLVFDGLENLQPRQSAKELVKFILDLQAPDDSRPAGSSVRVLASGTDDNFSDSPLSSALLIWRTRTSKTCGP